MGFIGRYRIIGELGRGAMGVVYHATDPSIGRSVAIKTIRIRDINDTRHRDKLRERLFREARSAGVLSHPNIVTIYDMDEAEGLAYIAMAYVNGPTLEKILSSDAPLSGANMLRILRQTASGLDYAHGRGIVHRDVKPANIMTDEDGAVKITDFGIAKITAAGNMTETRTVVGTPNYMSPEQVQGITVDGRSDQFSLAVIAYEILTGERPFQGEQLSTVVYRIVADQPAAAHLINPTLTPRIDAVLRKALAKNTEDRFPSCSGFVGALEMACAESRGWTTLTAGGGAAMPTAAIEREVGAPDQAPVKRSLAALPPLPPRTPAARRPSFLMPFLLSVFVVLGVAGVVVWQAGLIPAGMLPFGQHRDADPKAAPPPQEPAPARSDSPPGTVAKQAVSLPAAAQPPAPLPALVHKPSPFSAAARVETATQSEPREVLKVPAARIQDVWVTTIPPGARAVLDDNLALACQTPCMLRGAAGLHHLTISEAGYENEYRELHIADTALDVPLITLRRPSGTLMLTTNPPGASVRIDGRLTRDVTPAQITLAPGSYLVTVEKDGRSRTQRVDMQESLIYLRVPLDQ
jgi:tRNA A-37 threonylcarbamoyl transferase component Bud32